MPGLCFAASDEENASLVLRHVASSLDALEHFLSLFQTAAILEISVTWST